jgi:Trp operon repressor
MPRASKNKVKKDIRKEIEEALIWFISKELKNAKTGSYFLEEFLTKEERLMLGKRLFAGYLVKSGLNNREVSSILKVSTNTVLKANYRLQKQAVYREIIEKLIKKEKSAEFNKKLDRILRRILPLSRKDLYKNSGRSSFSS